MMARLRSDVLQVQDVDGLKLYDFSLRGRLVVLVSCMIQGLLSFDLGDSHGLDVLCGTAAIAQATD